MSLWSKWENSLKKILSVKHKNYKKILSVVPWGPREATSPWFKDSTSGEMMPDLSFKGFRNKPKKGERRASKKGTACEKAQRHEAV